MKDINNMRKLEFRAWNGESFEYSDELPSLETFFGRNEYMGYGPQTSFIQQCIGYKDQDGNGIYEGDFVTVDDGKEIYKIEFRGIGFWFVDENDSCWVFADYIYKLKIVGNIFQNQESLKNE